MWTFPVLLDRRPAFLPGAPGASLLLAPLGAGTVLSHLLARLEPVTGAPPAIVTTFEVDEAYERAIREHCPHAEAVSTLPAFIERSYSYEPSDRLLLVDPSCFLLDARDPALERLANGDDPRCVKHLVALERAGGGTKEFVDADASGRVRAIQRYYDSVTWPFANGIACSLVPVACLRVSCELPLASLSRLRRVLSTEGVPSRDLPLERGAVDLSSERGLLALNERLALALARPAARTGAPQTGARVHPSARIVGPVVLQDGAEIGEGVTLIGPAVVGRGSRLEAGSTVAQSVIGPGQVVPSGATVRHRVYFGEDAGAASEPVGEAPSQGHAVWDADPYGHFPEAKGHGHSRYPGLKRALDATAAALGLALLGPLSLLIAALIKLESRGPVLFGHLREGMGGRAFRCWKFRTMAPGADQQQRKLAQQNQVDGPQFKITGDPRRTRIGRILSASYLDEIPQILNVLAGEMSLVGPRPSPFRENQVCVPWRKGRLSVRPGITGLWQICRHDRHKGDFHQWIYFDLLYVRNLSFWLDLKILALTPLSFLRSGGIPLSWLLSGEQYGERRGSSRDREGATAAARRAS